jgi:hypothetical protein
VQALLPGRRRFLGTAAMTLAAARFGTVDALETNQQPSRLLMTLDRATGWINSTLSSVLGVAGKVVLVQFGSRRGHRPPVSSVHGREGEGSRPMVRQLTQLIIPRDGRWRDSMSIGRHHNQQEWSKSDGDHRHPSPTDERCVVQAI